METIDLDFVSSVYISIYIYIYSILPFYYPYNLGRRNIYDNDEFDVLSNRVVDPSKVHLKG